MLPPHLPAIHITASVAAVLAGFISLVWHREISLRSAWGRLYVLTTIVSVLTGFGIYNHGGFGVPHVLGIVTLVMLRVGSASGERRFGAASPYIEAVAFSATFFLHMIPGIVETATRLPVGAPLVPDRESPVLLQAIGVCFAIFLIGVTLQIIRLFRLSRRQTVPPATTPEPAPQLSTPSTVP